MNCDVIGVGWLVYDQLRAAPGASVVPINSAEATIAKEKSGQRGFVNRRAEWWFRLREASSPPLPSRPPPSGLTAATWTCPC